VNPVVPWMQANAIWYRRWFTDPGFRADVIRQWNTLKANGVFTQWLASIQQESQSLLQSQINNFGRWPMQGIAVWPNAEAAGSYSGEVAYLTQWLNLRISYLDSLFNNKTPTALTLNMVVGGLRAGSAVTLTAQVSSGQNPTGTVTFLSDGVVLGAGSLNGGTASFAASTLPAGAHNLQAVYNGDSSNALSASAVQAVIVAAPLNATVTSAAGPFAVGGENSSLGFKASVIANSGTAAPTGTVTFTVDSGSGTVSPLTGNGQASYTVGSLAAGTHTLRVSYSGDANYAASSVSPVTFQAGIPLAVPSVSSVIVPTVNRVLNAATGSQAAPEVLGAGSYVAIYGTGLAGNGSPSATSLPLPTTLNGTQVLLGGTLMPLLYAASGQVNALVPLGLTPNTTYSLQVIEGASQSMQVPVFVSELQPGIYTVDSSGAGAGVVTSAITGALITSSNPAHAGDYLSIYCTGLGALSGPNGQAAPMDGAAAPISPIFQTTTTVTATIGGLNAPVSFAGLTPTLAGLYQVNVQVPTGISAPSGVQQLVIFVSDGLSGASAQSNAVTVMIQ
jgi:uncharacterized protein (TIGR03437 family)